MPPLEQLGRGPDYSWLVSPDNPSESLQAAIDALQFDEARSIVEEAAPATRAELSDRVDKARADGLNRAEQLAGRIQSMARADHYEGLLALGDDETTDPLLALLPQEIRRGASLHLDGARRRQERFQTAALKHMTAASEALLLLDTTKARSELERVDRRWLDNDQTAALDSVYQQIEEAAAERRDLDARTAEVLRDHHPSQSKASRPG